MFVVISSTPDIDFRQKKCCGHGFPTAVRGIMVHDNNPLEFHMIIGLGSDLIDIRRIESSLDRFGERFVNRLFTETEIARSEGRKQRAASYAKRFAAKEACCKALGTGIAQGVFWRDMGVVNLASGKPTMELKNGALKRLNKLLPDGHEAVIHLTITDDFPLAQAFVVIEALPTRALKG